MILFNFAQFFTFEWNYANTMFFLACVHTLLSSSGLRLNKGRNSDIGHMTIFFFTLNPLNLLKNDMRQLFRKLVSSWNTRTLGKIGKKKVTMIQVKVEKNAQYLQRSTSLKGPSRRCKIYGSIYISNIKRRSKEKLAQARIEYVIVFSKNLVQDRELENKFTKKLLTKSGNKELTRWMNAE